MSTWRGALRHKCAVAAALFVMINAGPRVLADETIVVSPADTQGWFFIQEGANGSGAFVLGPATPPLGTGSARLVVDATGREILVTPAYGGLRMDDITAFSYSTYRAETDGQVVAPSLQFNIDYDLTDANFAFQGRLVFEPYQTAGNVVQDDTWQTWDALAGEWWSSGAPGNATCPQATPCTWAQVLAAFPNAGVHTGALSALLLRAGGPWAPGFDGNVDALVIGTNGVNTTYDFEPCDGAGCNDCNTNGVPDELDIAGGTSVDADTNGVPDECPAVPANDSCDNATPVGVPSSTPGSTTLATPDNVAGCGFSNTGSGVWYSVLGTGRPLTASTCNAANFDTAIAVYCNGCPQIQSSHCCTPHDTAGCDDAACQATVCAVDPYCCNTAWDGICAGEAEDLCGGCGLGDATCVGGSQSSECGSAAQLTWCSLAGAEYRILVSGESGASGDFTLTISEGPDLCYDGVACGPVGACCGGDTCFLDTVAGCTQKNGEFQGVGTSCADAICERPHPGWNAVDVGISLTANQPTYWSALTGQPATGGVSPFTILDPANGSIGELPGRPALDGSGERVLRGFIVAWAVNAGGEEIRWNHLKGDALIVNYDLGAAWEYTAYAFQAVNPLTPNGEPIGPSPGTLLFDGGEYDRGFDLLLLNFYASGAEFDRVAILDTELTLMPLVLDLRQETAGPVTTKASFTIWNQNETKLTGLDRCVTCWDSTPLSLYGAPNHFLIENLQTTAGKAQIDGLASALCNVDVDPSDGPIGVHPLDVVSEAAPLLGVQVRRLAFYGGPGRGKGGESPKFELAGETLGGMGTQAGSLQADLSNSVPPQRPAGVGAGRTAIVAAEVGPRVVGAGAQQVVPIVRALSDRATANEKGSLLIYPKVELRWDEEGQFLQDTFVDITNDFPADVQVQMYFVNGDPPTP